MSHAKRRSQTPPSSSGYADIHLNGTYQSISARYLCPKGSVKHRWEEAETKPHVKDYHGVAPITHLDSKHVHPHVHHHIIPSVRAASPPKGGATRIPLKAVAPSAPPTRPFCSSSVLVTASSRNNAKTQRAEAYVERNRAERATRIVPKSFVPGCATPMWMMMMAQQQQVTTASKYRDPIEPSDEGELF